MNDSPSNEIYRFGAFELSASAHVLRRDGRRVHLQPKAFETLLLLVSQAGQVVEKDTLLEQAWHGQVVSDNALTRAIREVRRALGDSASAPRFIETVPRVGYRFRATVERGAGGSVADEGSGARQRRAVSPLRWAALLVIAAVALVAAWWLGAQRGAAPLAPVTLAVEAPVNATGDPEFAYLGEGIMDGVARRLGASGDLGVLRLAPGEADQAARRFDADWLLSTSLGRQLDQTVIVAELSPVEGERAWRREFTLVDGDAVTAQQGLADAVAQTLGVALPPAPTYLALAADADRIRAHRLYLTGRGHLAQRRPVEVVRAVELFEQAVELMPDHAGALASLGIAYVLGPDGRFPPATARQRAAELFARALEIDPSTALAYAGQGLLLMDTQPPDPQAQALLEKALALDPNDPDALVWYATVLASEGRIREAAEVQRRALALESRNPSVIGNLAFNLVKLGQYDEALALLEPVAEDGLTEPMLYYQRFILLGQRGRLPELFDLTLEASLRFPRSPFFLGSLGHTAWQLGFRDLALALLDIVVERNPANPAVLAALADVARWSGDTSELEAWLARVASLPGVNPLSAATLPPPLLVPVALVQLDLGRPGRAAEILSERHVDPDGFGGWRGDLVVPADEVQWLALALRRDGQEERAGAWLEAVQRAIASRRVNGVKDFTPLLLTEARNLAMQGRGEAALARLEQLLAFGWHEVELLAEDPRWGALADTEDFRRLVARARAMTAEDRERVLAAHPPEAVEAAVRAALAGEDAPRPPAGRAATATAEPDEASDRGR